MFLKSDDKYISLGAAVEGAQRWFDCNKISYPELYFEEIYAPKSAHLAVVMDYEGELLGEVSIDVTFAYTERAFLHLRSLALCSLRYRSGHHGRLPACHLSDCRLDVFAPRGQHGRVFARGVEHDGR